MQDSIERDVEVAAPPARVWEALTDYRQFGQWFRVDLENPFAIGEVTRGVTTFPGYEGHRWISITRVMEAEAVFAFDWPHGEGDEAASGPMTRVTFRLEPVSGGTLVHIAETGFMGLPEDARMEALRSNTKGWEIQAGNIKAYVGG